MFRAIYWSIFREFISTFVTEASFGHERTNELPEDGPINGPKHVF
jgi:hypothetical protein